MTRLTLISILILTCGRVFAQELPRADTLANILGESERILEDGIQDIVDSQLADLLTRLEENPLDVNSASEYELQSIPALGPVLAYRIVTARLEAPFQSVEDLLRVDGLTEETLSKIRRFITVKGAEQEEGSMPLKLAFRTRNSSDLQDRRGYQTGQYLGSSLKSYNRLVASYGDTRPRKGEREKGIEVGVLFEKDAGEEKLNDFSAGYLFANIPSFPARLILGDYVVESAQGLVLWRSVGFSKGSEVIFPIHKGGSGIKPYISTDENLFFRGAGLEVISQDFSVLVFHSSKPLTGSIDQDGFLTSVFSDGYHRTASEIAKKNNSSERLSGFRVKAQVTQGIAVGATGYGAEFGHPLLLSDAAGAQGSNVSVGGFDFTYRTKNATIFGEMAKTSTSATAGILGLIYEPTRELDVALLARWYPKDFLNVHSFGFRESGGLTQNETGIYVGLKARITGWLDISTYYDQFRFPWRTSSLELPSSGNDFLFLADLGLLKRVGLQLVYKNRNKPFSESEIDFLGREKDILGQRNQRNYRITLDVGSSQRLKWRTRFESVHIAYSVLKQAESGYLWLQDGEFRIHRDFTLEARVIIFKTESFDSRLYEFEDDLRGTFSNPSLFGKGMRWYLLGRYNLTEFLQCSAKYATTIKDGVKLLSSGLNEIQGDAEGQISFQIDVIF